MKASSILITHPWMGRGGSEATAMWTLQAMQYHYSVTFVTASPMKWGELNAAYGTTVDPEKVKYVQAPKLPAVDGPAKLVQLQLRYFEKFCRSVAGDFDLCLSAYNPVNFGKPGIQLIGLTQTVSPSAASPGLISRFAFAPSAYERHETKHPVCSGVTQMGTVPRR